jgi:hypothetical protein
MKCGWFSLTDTRSNGEYFPACPVPEGSLILLTKTTYSCIFIQLNIVERVAKKRFPRPAAVKGGEADS